MDSKSAHKEIRRVAEILKREWRYSRIALTVLFLAGIALCVYGIYWAWFVL